MIPVKGGKAVANNNAGKLLRPDHEGTKGAFPAGGSWQRTEFLREDIQLRLQSINRPGGERDSSISFCHPLGLRLPAWAGSETLHEMGWWVSLPPSLPNDETRPPQWARPGHPVRSELQVGPRAPARFGPRVRSD
eukprot:767698-Hanusia_phi.AAC.5